MGTIVACMLVLFMYVLMHFDVMSCNTSYGLSAFLAFCATGMIIYAGWKTAGKYAEKKKAEFDPFGTKKIAALQAQASSLQQ